MKRTVKVTLIIVLFVASILTVTAVFAQTVEYTAVVDTGGLNVRQGPGVEYAPITVVNLGQTVTLLGRNDNSSWAKIRTPDNQEGWVNASYLTSSNVAISSLPVMTSSATPLPTPPAPVTPGGIAVRSGPGFTYSAAGFVANGSYINLLGRNSNSTWVKVSANNNTLIGWMNASVIETSLNIHDLPIVDGTTTPTTPTTTPTSDTASATITTGALNVRSGPGLGYSVLEQVYLGQTITLIGRNDSSTWVKATTSNGQQGWLSAGFIQANVAISSLPVIASPTLDSVGLVNTGTANVRSGPGLEYTVVDTAGLHSTVSLIGRNSANSWLKVQLANGTQGWIHASLLDINVAIGTLPAVD